MKIEWSATCMMMRAISILPIACVLSSSLAPKQLKNSFSPLKNIIITGKSCSISVKK